MALPKFMMIAFLSTKKLFFLIKSPPKVTIYHRIVYLSARYIIYDKFRP